MDEKSFTWKTYVLEILEKRISNEGYIFEVDLEYPEELWEPRNDYLLAPEKMKIDNVEKLVCTFFLKIITSSITRISGNILALE